MPQTSTTLDMLREKNALANNPATAHSVGFYDNQGYGLLKNIAKDFASSDIIPQRFQGKPANCMIAVEMAARMQASPLMVMQNLYVVYGTPAWSAQFLIACFNQCGRFTSIHYEFVGTKGKDDWGCSAYATEISTGDKIQGSVVTIELAKQEGWYSKKDKNGKETSKWQTVPEQMLMYRSAAWMIRTHAPEMAMGFQTIQEVEDTYNMEKGENGVYSMVSEELKGEVILPSTDETKPVPPAKKANPVPQATETPPQAEPKPEPTTEESSSVSTSSIVTCPDNGKKTDEFDCLECKKKPGCPAWKE